MIAVDTNIIVRLLAQDDQPQFRKSLQLFQPVQSCQALRSLFGLPTVRLSDASRIMQALQWHEDGMNFADAFHLLQSQQCSAFYTFDDKFLKKAKNLTQCEIRKLS